MRPLTSTVLVILLLFSLAVHAQSRGAWYAILGSFPFNEKGLEAANQLRDQFRTDDFNQDELIVAESSFYKGLTEELYVVMAGPFKTRQQASVWMEREAVQAIASDGYIKQAQERSH